MDWGIGTNKPVDGGGRAGNKRLPPRTPTLGQWKHSDDDFQDPPPYKGKTQPGPFHKRPGSVPGYSYQKKNRAKEVAAQKKAVMSELHRVTGTTLRRQLQGQKRQPKGWQGAKNDQGMRDVGQGEAPNPANGQPYKTYTPPADLKTNVKAAISKVKIGF